MTHKHQTLALELRDEWNAAQEIIDSVAVHHGALAAAAIARYVDVAASTHHQVLLLGGLAAFARNTIDASDEDAADKEAAYKSLSDTLDIALSARERSAEAIDRALSHSLTMAIGCRTREDASAHEHTLLTLLQFAQRARDRVLERMTEQARQVYLSKAQDAGDAP